MILRQSVKAEYMVVVNMADVYPSFTFDQPDAQNRVEETFDAILAVGIKPARVEFNVTGQFALIFGSWLEASECWKAVSNVLELLWLVDHPEEDAQRTNDGNPYNTSDPGYASDPAHNEDRS